MIKNFKELRERVKSSRPLVVSVAAAADTELLLAVKAAVEKRYDVALTAMLANPFINDYDVGKQILDELIEAHSPYLDYLKQ